MVNEANPNRAKNPRVRTWGGSADRPVVATAPKPYAPTAGVSAQQNARNADAYALTVPYVSGVKQEADRQAEADKITAQILGGQSYGGTGTRSDTAFQNALSMLTSGGTGSGKATGPKASDRLARDEFKYKKEQDAEAKAVRDRALQGMIDQISTNSYRGNIDDLLKSIGDMETTGIGNINDIYDMATGNIQDIYSSGMGNIGQGYSTAQGLMDTGYGALQSYLQQNQNNPYAGLSAQMPAVTNPMEDYLNAYGAMSPDIANQMQAEQLAGQQSAGAFQSLIDVLGANAKSNDLSRLAEAQMARTMGTTGLGAQRATYESELAKRKAASGFEASSAQQQALASLAQQIAQSKFEQEQAAGGRKQSIIDAIIAAGGSIPQPPPPPMDLSAIDFSALNNMFNPGM
jgi:hypothetical protein